MSKRIGAARYGYLVVATLFGAGVLVQVYIAGMAVFIDPENWELHTRFVSVIEPLPILLLVLAFLGQLPRRLKLSPVALFILMVVQYATASMFGSFVAAIHPVTALIMFVVAVMTVREVRNWVGS